MLSIAMDRVDAAPRGSSRRRQAVAWAGRVARPLAWLAMGLLVLLAGARDGSARLRPYYVLRTATEAAAVKPRILFVLDTSGSMGMMAQPTLEECAWERCENPAFAGTIHESRMAAARRAIHQVIVATQDDAKFALVTFDQHGPHNNAPAMCSTAAGNRRFVWITHYNYPDVGFPWHEIRRDVHLGAWRLCQGNDIRPYPYLRWDDLGVGSVVGANHQAGPLPPSPLIGTSYAEMSDAANAQRKVQWFPRFMGVRFQPNDTTDPDRAITHATTGDYGTSNADRNANVWQQDFYYWPYVDGFPGYSNYEVNPPSSGNNHAGVIGQVNNVQDGQLYAPFYLDLSTTPVNPNAWGPATEQEATALVLSHTSPLVQGGVDAVGYTPWYSTIGPIPAAPTQSNGYNAHTTVSSYLAFVRNVQSPDVCAPTAAVLVTDGTPYPANEGGWRLYRRLANLRTQLDTRVYVVGFFLEGEDELNAMACAGAGACDGTQCDTPCDDQPTHDWDTCANPADPANGCAFLASSADELQQVLSQIVAQIGEFELPSGPPSTANEFGVAGGGGGDVVALQTTISAITEYPTWRGHVVRSYCEFTEPGTGNLLSSCVPPSPEFEAEAYEETFGPCPQSRAWDAGECLSLTPWTERRLYTHDASNQLVPVSEPDGTASGQFVAELVAQGIVSGANAEAEADELVAFLLGRDAPNGWKLPGLANSAPIIVQRVPPYDPERIPTVAIRDPHCGGRLLGASDGVPVSLEEYAEEVWDDDNKLAIPSEHFESQEAVLIGDDFGVLHAFQLDSGNELWGFLPRFLLPSLAEKAALGAATYGQTGEIEDHRYGIAATVNRGWVFDDRAVDPAQHRWRQLAIVGMGPGGTEHMVLDVSHMSPESPQGPFEVLWTTADPALEAQYDAFNGETWARPALGYHVPDDVSTQAPDSYFVMGTGYPLTGGGGSDHGRTLLRVDALTGQIVEHAVLPPVDPTTLYEPVFGTVTDVAVGTHCLSRLWAEMQEAYVVDPAGRLFRWDLGRETNHAADSGGVWGNAATPALATPIPACEGAGATCTVNPGNRAETFTFAAAVSSNDRLDDITSVSTAAPIAPTNQFLVALAGGSPADDALRVGPGASYQSSLYVLVDDHTSDPTAGFDVPAGAPKTAPGAHASFMRVALTDLERTRTLVPFDGSATYQETRSFARGTRPLRAPRIFVTGVVDEETLDEANPTVIEGVEVYNIQFTVYEPPSAICNQAFYDDANDQWHEDPGSTFLITFRLTANVGTGFDLINGAGAGGASGANFGAGFSTGLTLASVEQIGSGECANGGCGPQLLSPSTAPCDPNASHPITPAGAGAALAATHSELPAFTPVE
jgi:hypothetical protein